MEYEVLKINNFIDRFPDVGKLVEENCAKCSDQM
jgi:hypothetical protein